jgi:hypothetical protein
LRPARSAGAVARASNSRSGTTATRRRLIGLGLAAAFAPWIGFAQQDADLQWLFDIAGGTDSEADAALGAIEAGRRIGMAAGLILTMRFVDVREAEISATLQAVTCECGARRWFDWMLWQESHPEVVPSDSYSPFMRALHLRIDPEFDRSLRLEYLTRSAAKIRVEEITWGGVVKDGIPSLDNPAMIAGAQAEYLRTDDLVFGISINGDVRVYPLRIMGWHEMFNDVIGGVPVALAYCTLCGSGILFETRVKGRGRPLIFGSSGFLYRSNKLMFDRATQSLWNQFTGQPVSGKLADSGILLVQRPVVIARWDDWLAANPKTQVLALETGYRRDYGSGVVYQDYFASDALMFPALADEGQQRQKDYVFGIRRFAGRAGLAADRLCQKALINDAVADFPVVLIGDPDGRTVCAYNRSSLKFSGNPGALVSDDGAAWTMGEEALTSADGRSLARVAGQVSYLFAWERLRGRCGHSVRFKSGPACHPCRLGFIAGGAWLMDRPVKEPAHEPQYLRSPLPRYYLGRKPWACDWLHGRWLPARHHPVGG